MYKTTFFKQIKFEFFIVPLSTAKKQLLWKDKANFHSDAQYYMPSPHVAPNHGSVAYVPSIDTSPMH